MTIFTTVLHFGAVQRMIVIIRMKAVAWVSYVCACYDVSIIAFDLIQGIIVVCMA